MLKSNKTILAGIVSALFITTATNAIELTSDTSYYAPDIYKALSSGNRTIDGNNFDLNINRDNEHYCDTPIISSSGNININDIKNFKITDTAPSGHGSDALIRAQNTNKITINSNDTFKIESDHYIPLHAIGGDLEIQAKNQIDIVAHNDNAVFVQNNSTGTLNQNASLTIGNENSNADISIIGNGAVNVASLTTSTAADASNPAVSFKMWGNKITLEGKNDFAAINLYDQSYGYTGTGSGSLNLMIHAKDTLTLTGSSDGILMSRHFDGETPTKTVTVAELYSEKEISITGQNGLSVADHTGDNTIDLIIDAPSIDITATGTGTAGTGFAAYVVNGNVTLGGEGETRRQITLSAPKNSAAILATTADSNITIENSDLNIKSGNVSSEGILNLKNSRLSLAADSMQFKVANLTGDESQIIVNGANTDLSVTNNNLKNLQVLASGSYADQFATAEAAFDQLLKQTQYLNPNESTTLGAEAGTVADAWTWTYKDKKFEVNRNAAMESFSQFNAMTLTQWRAENNHLSKRLGDVRSTRGEIGSWARIYGYDSRLKDSVNTEVKATSIQVGSDVSVGKNWIIGGAFTYTDMSGDFDTGSSDADSYSLSAYATGLFDCGGFIDVIGRVGRISTDISASTLSADGGVLAGSYDNTAFALSVETGYHWTPASIFYVEPQAELSYSYVLGDSFTSSANGVSIDQDDFQSLVGRFGAQIGASLPQDAGRIYVEASINHDFLGDADATATPAQGAARHLSSDLGSTWYSYGIGLQLTLTDHTSFYGSLDRANGNEYQENYRYSVGLRHVW